MQAIENCDLYVQYNYTIAGENIGAIMTFGHFLFHRYNCVPKGFLGLKKRFKPLLE